MTFIITLILFVASLILACQIKTIKYSVLCLIGIAFIGGITLAIGDGFFVVWCIYDTIQEASREREVQQ